MMSNDELQAFIQEHCADPVFETGKQYLNAIVAPEHLMRVAEALRHDPRTSFDYMFCLSGVDFSTHFMVVYHLESTTLNHCVVLKCKVSDRVNPDVPSVSSIWRTAEFHEREVYDLFGVRFVDHPDLRRILLDDDWVGHPMRKDYVDEANIVQLG